MVIEILCRHLHTIPEIFILGCQIFVPGCLNLATKTCDCFNFFVKFLFKSPYVTKQKTQQEISVNLNLIFCHGS